MRRLLGRQKSGVSACLLQLLADNAAQEPLKVGTLSALDVLLQRLVDERLVVAPAGNLIPKPLDDFGIEPDGDPLLAAFHDRAALGLGKIVLVSHVGHLCAYARRSEGVAGRAEMMRMVLS